MFEKQISFPHSYDDLDLLYQEHLKDAWEEEDAFKSNDLLNNGRSYSFYGQKVFEFYPGDGPKARFRLFGKDLRALGLGNDKTKDDALYTVSEKELNDVLLESFIDLLTAAKKKIFRNTVTEEFGCCNDFMKCSDARECLYPRDRFYNGCQYRRNLEAGRIFYGKNRNVEGGSDL
mgnify:CR=1 FL=1